MLLWRNLQSADTRPLGAFFCVAERVPTASSPVVAPLAAQEEKAAEQYEREGQSDCDAFLFSKDDHCCKTIFNLHSYNLKNTLSQ